MIKKYLPIAIIYALVFFGLSSLIIQVTHGGYGVIIASLILANTLTVFAVSLYMTYTYGFDITHMIIMVVMYIASAYIIFNESALGYIFLYLIADLIGYGIGSLVRKRK